MELLDSAKTAASTETQAKAGAKSPEERQKEQARLREACRMFEAMFLGVLWKEMRRTVPKGGIMNGGFAEEMFTSLRDQAISEASARSGSMGIASLMEYQLSQKSWARPGVKIGQELWPSAAPGDGSAPATLNPQGYLRRPLKPLSGGNQSANSGERALSGLSAGPPSTAEALKAASFAAAVADTEKRVSSGFDRSF